MLTLLLIFASAFTISQSIFYVIASYDKSNGIGFTDDLFFDEYYVSATIGFIADVVYLFYKYITA